MIWEDLRGRPRSIDAQIVWQAALKAARWQLRVLERQPEPGPRAGGRAPTRSPCAGWPDMPCACGLASAQRERRARRPARPASTESMGVGLCNCHGACESLDRCLGGPGGAGFSGRSQELSRTRLVQNSRWATGNRTRPPKSEIGVRSRSAATTTRGEGFIYHGGGPKTRATRETVAAEPGRMKRTAATEQDRSAAEATGLRIGAAASRANLNAATAPASLQTANVRKTKHRSRWLGFDTVYLAHRRAAAAVSLVAPSPCHRPACTSFSMQRTLATVTVLP